MPTFVKDATFTLSREAAQYAAHLAQQNTDASLQHYLIIECWDDASASWQPALCFEPTHDKAQAILQDVFALWSAAHPVRACACVERYADLLAARADLLRVTHSLVITQAAIDALPKRTPAAQREALQTLVGKVFLLRGDAQDAIVAALRDALPDDAELLAALTTVGTAVMDALRRHALDPAYHQRRLAMVTDALAEFGGVAPTRPAQPTHETCPFCHLPRAYSFAAWLLADTAAMSRMMSALADGKVRPRHLPLMAMALESWLFPQNEELEAYQKKMFPSATVTGTLLQSLSPIRQAYLRTLTERLSASTDTTSTDSATPPPMPPDASPRAN